MHSRAAVSEVMALRRGGLGARRIAHQTGLPLATVRDWLAGRVPKRSRVLDPTAPFEPACEQCGHDAPNFEDLPPAYVYLLGLYLGDGCISPLHRGVFRLRIALDRRYPGIIESAADAVREIRQGAAHIQPQAGNWVVVSSYWKSWPCLLPQHAPGEKHERRIILMPWQVELVERWPDHLLRGLIHSDGCRFHYTGRGNSARLDEFIGPKC